MKKRLILSTLSLTVLLAGLFLVIFPSKSHALIPTTGGAGDSYTFQDRANINGNFANYGQVTFTDSNVFNGNNTYVPQGNTFCDPNNGSTYGISIPNRGTPFSAALITGQLNVGIPSGGQGNCQSVPENGSINIINSGSVANAKYIWNGNDISSLPGQTESATFQLGPNSTQYYFNNSSISYYSLPCDKSAILVDSSKSGGTFFCFTQNSAKRGGGTAYPNPPQSIQNWAPKDNNGNFLGVSFQYHTNIAGTPGTTPPGGAGGGGTNSTSPTCDTSGFQFSWLLCSVISGAADTVNHMYYGLIVPLLNFKASSLLDQNQPFYKVWSTFRTYGDVILIIVLLVIIIGESISGGS